MYRNHYLRMLGILIFTFVVTMCIQNRVIGFNLAEQIVSKIGDYYKQDFSDEDFSNIYSSKFSKDPFGDAMLSIEGRSNQLKVAGAQYVEQLLKQKGCKLSEKEIFGMLYYFVPEFRTELAMSLKQEYGDYDSRKYVFTDGEIAEYCGKYFLCEKSEELDIVNYSATNCEGDKNLYYKCISDCENSSSSKNKTCCKDERKKYEECLYESKWSEIKASTPADVETNCREFFKSNYEIGENGEGVLQNVEIAQMGADKYWNNTIDDSPYDIMSDLEVLAKLLYYGVEGPITPVIYNIPMFSNSNKNLAERKDSKSLSDDGSQTGGGRTGDLVGDFDIIEGEGALYFDDGGGGVSLFGGESRDQSMKLVEDGGRSYNIRALSSSDETDGYDDLVEGLNSLSLGDSDMELYSSLCKDEGSSESEQEILEGDEKLVDKQTLDFSELSDLEYQEIIDYMIDAVDGYSELPEDKEEEIQQNVGDIDNLFGATDTMGIEEAKEKIKNCWKSCEGLRIDQKASCMLKCACGEIRSPIFNPEKTPGLGPIFLIRFCAIPAVNTNFSVGGKRIYSIEEGLNEIYGVVDKLSREGRLGKWTQQNEFLDSSTKKINIANTLAFTVDVEFVDISNRNSTHSNQYDEKSLKNFNQKALLIYGISNPLVDPLSKNIYRIGGDGGTEQRFQPAVDLVEDSKASRFGTTEESIASWMDQQGGLWKKMSEDFLDWIEYSEKLYTKKS